jgi:hypothetical protein
MPHSDGAGPAQNLHRRRSVKSVGLLRSDFSRCCLVEDPAFPWFTSFGCSESGSTVFFYKQRKEGAREKIFLPLQSYTVSTYFPNVYSGFRTGKLGINAGGFQYNLSILLLQRTTHYDAVYSLLRARGLISMFCNRTPRQLMVSICLLMGSTRWPGRVAPLLDPQLGFSL